MNATACIIEANPDVSGVGIRISIYALCLGGSIVSYLLRVFYPGKDQEEFSRGVSSALGMQGLALLCTAIYQTFRDELTLFHAICVIHLLAILGMDLVSKGRYTGLGPLRLYYFASMQILALGAFLAFNVYVWVTAPRFGSQPKCNTDTVYVVFGVSVKATSPVFRYIILGSLGAIVASFAITFVCMLPCLFFMYRRRNPAGGRAEGLSRGWIHWSVEVSPAVYTDRVEPPKRLHGQALLKYTLNKVAYCSFCVYLIVSLEQTISRNHLDPEEKGWTFGQVIAIFLLLGVANELLNVLLATWDRKKNENSQQLVQVTSDSVQVTPGSANSVHSLA